MPIRPAFSVSALAVLAHLFLWFMARVASALGMASSALWASKTRVKLDRLSWEPVSCGLNRAYTDMGLSYLAAGRIEEAIECLTRSWKVLPCPHNTSFGLAPGLCRALRRFLEAEDADSEYLEMWKRFRSV